MIHGPANADFFSITISFCRREPAENYSLLQVSRDQDSGNEFNTKCSLSTTRDEGSTDKLSSSAQFLPLWFTFFKVSLDFSHVQHYSALQSLLFQTTKGGDGMRTRGIMSLDCTVRELEVGQ